MVIYAQSQLSGPHLPALSSPLPSSHSVSEVRLPLISTTPKHRHLRVVCSSSDKKGVPNSNYVVPLNKSFSAANSSCITRPLAEILRDLNKRIPDNIAQKVPESATFIPWFHANRMLSFYAPGWCGEIRDVIFSDNGSVTVVYRVTVRGSDGEAHRESTGTVSATNGSNEDPVAAAEEIAFCKACARFGLGLYLYHEE
ncbi:DNA repair RAD52-like protein 2, chloroplastic [Cucurbita pepo subsp. pepo]|uniref:DNA repair RAD52-like protein 2, chloroplastic n=1 Tax=Cucurbita pepo subsp. pepo TaxID=3664 RepID=UPI000C9D8587|nr:DNA repair RAD52-like protein 2, chloroplastic [Cucurbita pepo subsp. pepo]XP_023536297.1 DNA repair RAD52-like protein 2, chloroplastic [Cucurbita pepo subsp. pepo]